MSWWRFVRVAVLVLPLGFVLSPLRASAATDPVLFAYDLAVRLTATTWLDAGTRIGVPICVCEDAHYADLGVMLARATNAAGAVQAYDNAANQDDRRALAEGVIYDAGADVNAAEGVVASDAINGPRLATQLVREEAKAAFTSTGELSDAALEGSRQIIAPGQLGNPAIPPGFAKFSTQTFNSPSGPFQVHFYRNPSTGQPFYGRDFKAIFNGERGPVPFRPFSGNAQ